MTQRHLLYIHILLLFVGCHATSKDGADIDESRASRATRQSSAGPGKDAPDTVKILTVDQARAGIKTDRVLVKRMPRTLVVSGQVAMDEKHTSHIGALADGRVESVTVLPGDFVRHGQTIATIHSHTVHETVAALTQAYTAVARQKSAVSFANQARDRYARLYEIQAASLEEKQRSEDDLALVQKNLADAQATLIAEREHLAEILQVAPESLQLGSLYDKEVVPVRPPADGVVIGRNITVGQVVTTGNEIFVISNLSTVWVNAAVNEKDVPLLRVGRSASISLQPSVQRALSGTVTMIGDLVDPQTRTLPVRIVVANPGATLKPGMFVSAAISEPETKDAIFVPQDALQDINGFKVVFTTLDGVTFHATTVRSGVQSGNLVEILEGLSVTDRVVVNGAFMVKGEMLKGSIGED